MKHIDLTEGRFNDVLEAANYIKESFWRSWINFIIGISYNKFLAKLASDWNKPNGIMIITEEMIPDISHNI